MLIVLDSRPFERARRRTLFSIFAFVAISITKLLVGWVFGFQIVLADGIHNLADALMMIAAYVGIVLAQKPLKRTGLFPYGLYKGENLISLFMSIIIIFGAIEVMLEGLRPAKSSGPLMPTAVEIGSLLVVAFLGYWVSRAPEKPSVVVAEVVHDYQDALVSFIVIAGIFFEYYRLFRLYLIALLIVVVYLAYQALSVAKDSVLTLLDASDARVESEIAKAVSSVTGIIGFHELKVRKSGPYYFAEMHLELPRSVSVEEADEIADAVEEKIKETVPRVIGVTIHVEPGTSSGKWNIAVSADSNGIITGISQAEFFYIYYAGKAEPRVLPSPIAQVERRRVVALIDFLKQNAVNALITAEVEQPAAYALRGAGIDVYISRPEPAGEAILKFRAGGLKGYTEKD